MIDLEKILKLEAVATKAPWDYDDGMRWGGYSEPPMPQVKPSVKIGDDFIEFDNVGYDFDAELIAEMRNNIKQICLELKAAREVINSARFVLARHDSGIFGGHQDIACSACVLDANIREYDEVINGKG